MNDDNEIPDAWGFSPDPSAFPNSIRETRAKSQVPPGQQANGYCLYRRTLKLLRENQDQVSCSIPNGATNYCFSNKFLFEDTTFANSDVFSSRSEQ